MVVTVLRHGGLNWSINDHVIVMIFTLVSEQDDAGIVFYSCEGRESSLPPETLFKSTVWGFQTSSARRLIPGKLS